MYKFWSEGFCVIKTCPIWDRNLKLICFGWFESKKDLIKVFFREYQDIKSSDLLPLLLPQPYFWEKKNPNYLKNKELGFLNVVPPGLEPGTNWLWVSYSNQLSYRTFKLYWEFNGCKITISY